MSVIPVVMSILYLEPFVKITVSVALSTAEQKYEGIRASVF